MRVLITGSRHWTDEKKIGQQLAMLYISNYEEISDPKDYVIVHGDCPSGADAIADRLAREMGHTVERYPAEWDKHGKAAGPLRNQKMVDLGADLCLAFPLPGSRGTIDCMKRARLAGIPIIEVNL